MVVDASVAPPTSSRRGATVAAVVLVIVALVLGTITVLIRVAQRPPHDAALLPDLAWQVGLALTVLAGLAAVTCAVVGWRRGSWVVHSAGVIAVLAVVATGIGVQRATSHRVWSRIVALDPGTGRPVWTAEPGMVNVVAMVPRTDLEVDGVAPNGRCDTRWAVVRLSPRDGTRTAPLATGDSPPFRVAPPPDGPTSALRDELYSGHGVDVRLRSEQSAPAKGSASSSVPLPTVPSVAVPAPAAAPGARPPLTTPALAAPVPASGLTFMIEVTDSTTGERRWTRPVPEGPLSVAATGDGVYVSDSVNRRIDVYDLVTGAAAGHHPVDQYTWLWSLGEHLMAADGDGITGLGPGGSVRWRTPVPRLAVGTQSLVNLDGLVVAVEDGRTAYLCNLGE